MIFTQRRKDAKEIELRDFFVLRVYVVNVLIAILSI
jgi:hypothetical protein